MQQATINLFADMGAQPGDAAVRAGAARRSRPTPLRRPSTITSPAAGANVTDGTKVTITGTATDTGGGVVAGVEVSTDGGSTWHPAPRARPHGPTAGPCTAHRPRTSASARPTTAATSQPPAPAVTVNVACPCSIWGDAYTPAQADSGDTGSIELGVKFTSDVYGAIIGRPLLQGRRQHGHPHRQPVGRRRHAAGAGDLHERDRLGLAEGDVRDARAVQPGHDLHRVATSRRTATTRPPRTTSARPGARSATAAARSTRRRCTRSQPRRTAPTACTPTAAPSTFPTSSFTATNYWVDVMFAPTPAPGAVTNVTATAAGTTSAPCRGRRRPPAARPTTYKITPYIGWTAQTPTTVSGAAPPRRPSAA